jgi:hypothetical protein
VKEMKKYFALLAMGILLVFAEGCRGYFTVKSEANDIELPLTGIQNNFSNASFKFYVMKKVEVPSESVTVVSSSWAFVARSDTPVTFEIKVSSEDISDSTDYLMVFDTTGLSRYIPSYLLNPFLDAMRNFGYEFNLPSAVNSAPVLISGNVSGTISDSLNGSSQLNSTLESAINKGEMWVIVNVTAQSNYFPPVTTPEYMHLDRLTGHIEVEVDMSFLEPLLYLTF